MASLFRVLNDIGTTVLTSLCGEPSASVELSGVTLHDPVDDGDLPERTLVLDIGLTEAEEVVERLDRLGAARAAGLVVRSSVPVTAEVAEASTRSGVALLGLARGASWAQLAAAVHAVTAAGPSAEPGVEDVPAGDLFALANAITATIDAPITIVDRSSRVLAFSERQHEGDPMRVETVLGRQVPQRFTSAYVRRGVFDEVYRSDAPVWVDAEVLDTDLPRVVVAVRAGDEVLGTIWAVARAPMSPERRQALRDAAALVAVHLLRARGGSSGVAQVRSRLVNAAVTGGADGRDALHSLGLADRALLVLAMGLVSDGPETMQTHARDLAKRRRISAGLAIHLTAVHPRCATALVGEVCYALMPVGAQAGEVAEGRAVRIATEFLTRHAEGADAVVGISQVAAHPVAVADLRASTDRVLRVLLARSAGGVLPVERRVARFEDVHVETLLLELHDLVVARGERPTGPVARLLAHDAAKDSRLVETLRAGLDAFGDVTVAAVACSVHPNTFRYRLRRAVEVSGLDLTDADARLAAMLQLRVLNHPVG